MRRGRHEQKLCLFAIDFRFGAQSLARTELASLREAALQLLLLAGQILMRKSHHMKKCLIYHLSISNTLQKARGRCKQKLCYCAVCFRRALSVRPR